MLGVEGVVGQVPVGMGHDVAVVLVRLLAVAGGAVGGGWVGKAGGKKAGDGVALRALAVEVLSGAVGFMAALAIGHAGHGMVKVDDAPGLADGQQPPGKPGVKPA